ncbi:MAG: cyclic nucleotide-binding domain-containing protein [Verrucomicrobiae bacterium]|nr:cyclic nucleotide-binding domain-containing protein [Verrucomicrobiae bacterium]MCX7721674.1 cyclic nucleotide-binding domain-containing protein [Verrucomicrobiae bacterium]MDW7979381.1 cyclic nucleotide-binding domain-containing protein [Verrucomicrobiales bacterium]
MAPLEACELFSGLEPAALAAVRKAAEQRKYLRGQEIFSEGDPGDGLYVIAEGAVEICGVIADAHKYRLARYGPGDFFGELALVDDKPRAATAVALRDSIIYFIPREVMLRLLEETPGMALKLLRLVGQRLRDFDREHARQLVQNERLAAVGQLARAVLHDLKNPLAILSLTLDSSYTAQTDTATRRAAEARIRRQLHRISELVNDIMEFTQPQQPIHKLEPVNYPAFIEQTVGDIQPELVLRNVQLVVANRPPNVMVAMKPTRLKRVLFNLCDNAADAMPEGGRITLYFGRTEGEVITEIQDTGPGIPPEILDRLFEPFATFGKAHGTGLGLSICHRIIEDHHGRIWGHNLPGGGAVFAFALPIWK